MRNLMHKEITIISPDDPSGGTSVIAFLQEQGSSESEGTFTSSDWLLVVGPDVEIDNQDRILHEGQEFEVANDPQKIWNHRANTHHHTEIQLRIAGTSDPSTEFPQEDDF